MKKVLIVAAAAGLMSLAACTPAATNNTAEPEANAAAYDSATDNEVDANAVAPDANAVAPANEVEAANTTS